MQQVRQNNGARKALFPGEWHNREVGENWDRGELGHPLKLCMLALIFTMRAGTHRYIILLMNVIYDDVILFHIIVLKLV